MPSISIFYNIIFVNITQSQWYLDIDLIEAEAGPRYQLGCRTRVHTHLDISFLVFRVLGNLRSIDIPMTEIAPTHKQQIETMV